MTINEAMVLVNACTTVQEKRRAMARIRQHSWSTEDYNALAEYGVFAKPVMNCVVDEEVLPGKGERYVNFTHDRASKPSLCRITNFLSDDRRKGVVPPSQRLAIAIIVEQHREEALACKNS